MLWIQRSGKLPRQEGPRVVASTRETGQLFVARFLDFDLIETRTQCDVRDNLQKRIGISRQARYTDVDRIPGGSDAKRRAQFVYRTRHREGVPISSAALHDFAAERGHALLPRRFDRDAPAHGQPK